MGDVWKEAKQLRESHHHSDAIKLYAQLWNSEEPLKNDMWLGWECMQTH